MTTIQDVPGVRCFTAWESSTQKACRREHLSQMFERLTPLDLRIIGLLKQEEATEPQAGRTQVEIWTRLQEHAGFGPVREALNALYKAGLLGRQRGGKKDRYYLTRDGQEI